MPVATTRTSDGGSRHASRPPRTAPLRLDRTPPTTNRHPGLDPGSRDLPRPGRSWTPAQGRGDDRRNEAARSAHPAPSRLNQTPPTTNRHPRLDPGSRDLPPAERSESPAQGRGDDRRNEADRSAHPAPSRLNQTPPTINRHPGLDPGSRDLPPAERSGTPAQGRGDGRRNEAARSAHPAPSRLNQTPPTINRHPGLDPGSRDLPPAERSGTPAQGRGDGRRNEAAQFVRPAPFRPDRTPPPTNRHPGLDPGSRYLPAAKGSGIPAQLRRDRTKITRTAPPPRSPTRIARSITSGMRVR
jgi:hypothetical protein